MCLVQKTLNILYFFSYRHLCRGLIAVIFSLYRYQLYDFNIASTNDYKLSYASEILNRNNKCRDNKFH